MTCPVVKAINEIKGGAGEKETPGVIIGSGEDSEMYHAGAAMFRASAAKIELARYKLSSIPYDGDLVRFFGQQRRFALCYLLDSSNSRLCHALRDFVTRSGNKHPDIVPDLCLIYPNILRESIDRLVDQYHVHVDKLPTLEYDREFLNGFFTTKRNEDGLNQITDELMQVAQIASLFEDYQLRAAAKIIEIASLCFA